MKRQHVRYVGAVLAVAVLSAGCKPTPPKPEQATPTLTAPSAQGAPEGTPGPIAPLSPNARTEDERNTISVFREASDSTVFVTQTKVVVDDFEGTEQEVPVGSGSGFVWDTQGHIVTNFHVVKGARTLTVTFGNQKTFRAEVVGVEQFISLLDSKKPAIIFAAHLANWELPGVVAARYGLDTTIVFRPPNNKAVARAIEVVRGAAMGRLLPSGPGAASAMVGVLERGGRLAMLADQHLTRGLIVSFMGRPALANPVLAKLARRFDCPVHGTRCVRLPGGRFKLELTPPLELPRDAEGHIEVEGAMRAITAVIESWVREHPEQWLWQHRRWRVPQPSTPDRG